MKTPQQSYPALATALATTEVWLKFEDQHFYGSHKGRSIPHMIEHYAKAGQTNFVISSSGNAGLAAVLFVHHHNENNPDQLLALTVLVGNKIPANKLTKLQAHTDAHIIISQVENPRQTAWQLAQTPGVRLLRQSTDDTALTGYAELAEELNHIPNLQAVFIPTSSGTTAQALAQTFQKLNPAVQIHVVQTDAVHPIAAAFQNPLCPTHARTISDPETSIAGAIVDKLAERKFPVIEAVLQTHGQGWIVNDTEIIAAQNLVQKTTEYSISPNSALSVAGLVQALQAGCTFSGAVACLITGE